jgi:hypothetical protein
LWVNNTDSKTFNPGACIDNVQITKKAAATDCWKAVANLKATANTNGITLSWDAVAGAASYDIIYFLDGAPQTDTIQGISATSYFFPYSMLKNGLYTFWVRVNCAAGESYWLEIADVRVIDPNSNLHIPRACPTIEFNNYVHSGNTKVIQIPYCSTPGTAYTLKPEIGATGGRIAGYEVMPIPFAPPFPIGPAQGAVKRFANAQDDNWSDAIELPFDFCFFENTYSQAVIGSNGIITFDMAHAGKSDDQTCPFDYSGAHNIPSPDFVAYTTDKKASVDVFNSIFGVFEDIHTGNVANSNAGVFAGILGEYPCRTLTVSFKDVPLFGGSLNAVYESYQIVLYEGSNVIDVYVEHRENNSSINSRGIIGVVNRDGTNGVAAPGRNASDSWQVLSADKREAWRFIPIATPTYEIAWHKGVGFGGELLGQTDSLVLVAGALDNDTVTVRLQFVACNGDYFDYSDTAVIQWASGVTPDTLRIDSTICKGSRYQTQYFNVNTAGVYQTMVRTALGCDTLLLELDLKVLQPQYNNVDTVTICYGETYTWHDKTQPYKKEGLYLARLPYSTSVCDSLLDSLYLRVLPKIEYTAVKQNITTGGPNSGSITISNLAPDCYYAINGVRDAPTTGLAAGSYSIVVFNKQGCSTQPQTLAIDVEYLKVDFPDTTARTTCADTQGFNLPYKILNGYASKYSIFYDGKALSAGFKDTIITNVAGGDSVSIRFPANVRPDDYTARIVFEDLNSSSNNIEFNISFHILYTASVIRQKWNDVLAMQNQDYNGGYLFSSFRWYKNGFPQTGENGSYLYLENGEVFNPDDYYQVGLVRLGESKEILTCPVYPELHSVALQYPTMLAHGETWKIKGLDGSGNIQLWDTLSRLWSQKDFNSGEASIVMPNRSGVYQIRITGNDGTVKNISVMVY